MRIQIDIEKSLKSGRLQPKSLSLDQKVNVAFYLILVLVFIAAGLLLPTMLLVQSLRAQESTSVYVLLSLFYPFGIITVYGILNDNRLLKIKGKDFETNKVVMLRILKEKYRTEMIYEGESMFVYYKRADLLHFALRTIVLFDNTDVLINVSRFNQIGIKSFFHPIFSMITIQSIRKAFLKKMK